MQTSTITEKIKRNFNRTMNKPGFEGDGEIGIVEANVEEEGGDGEEEEGQALEEKGKGGGEEDGGNEEEDHGSLAAAQRLRCHGRRRSGGASQGRRLRDKEEREKEFSRVSRWMELLVGGETADDFSVSIQFQPHRRLFYLTSYALQHA